MTSLFARLLALIALSYPTAVLAQTVVPVRPPMGAPQMPQTSFTSNGSLGPTRPHMGGGDSLSPSLGDNADSSHRFDPTFLRPQLGPQK
jgi:hypothetical protein